MSIKKLVDYLCEERATPQTMKAALGYYTMVNKDYYNKLKDVTPITSERMKHIKGLSANYAFYKTLESYCL